MAIDRILTERKTPMPANITFAGENTYKIHIRQCLEAYINSRVETDHADTPGNRGRKRAEDVDSWG